MIRSRLRLPRLPAVGLLAILSLSVTNCGTSLLKRSDPASRVAVGNQDILFVGLPVLSDTALSALSAIGWGEGRFQSELRKEIAFQFERKKIRLTQDSAAAKAWLAVRLVAYEIGGEDSRYQGDAGLRTSAGERQIAIQKPKGWGSAERSDPTVDHIRQIAETVAAQARQAPGGGSSAEPAPQMWMIF